MITSISYLPNAVSTSVAAQARVGAGSQNPLASLQNRESSAIAQLSAYGQVKSSLADLQNRANALKTLNQPPTFLDFQAVVQSFVQSFNALSNTVRDATAKQAVLASDNRSRQALNEVRKATFGGNQSAVAAMNNLGVVSQANGAVAINPKQLEKNFQENRPEAVATLVDLANRVSITTNKQLADNGVVGKTVNDLSARVGLPGSARSAVQGYLETQATPPQQPVSVQLVTASVARNAVVTYAGVAAL